MLNSRVSSALDLTPSETKQTIQLLQACDRDINVARGNLAVNQLVEAKQDEIIKDQAQEMVQLKSQESSLFHSPAFWFVTGMLVTGLTVRLVR